MTVHQNPGHSADGLTAGIEDSAFSGEGVRLRAHCRHQATVVTISGEVDAANGDRVHAFATRFLTVGNAMILDLSGIEFFSAGCISVLIGVDDACRTADVAWTLVASRIVNRLLRLIDGDTSLPMASSVPEALEQVAELTRVRRRLALAMSTAQRHAV